MQTATKSRPARLIKAVQQLHDLQSGCWANQAWALLALLHYRRRQVWVMQELKNLVLDQASHDLRHGLSGHGYIHGMPEWEYEVNEVHFTVTSRVTRERIRIFCDDYEVICFDEFDFENYVLGMEENFAPPALLRAKQLHRTGRSLWLTLRELQGKGCFQFEQDNKPLPGDRLVDEILDYDQLLNPFLDLWGDADGKMWAAAHVGDWEIVRKEAERIGDAELLSFANEQYEGYRCNRLALWRTFGNPEDTTGFSIFGLPVLCLMADLDANDLDETIQICLRHGGEPAIQAFSFLSGGWIDDSKWCPAVMDLLKDVLSRRWKLHDGNPQKATRFSAFLIQHDYNVGVVLTLLAGKTKCTPDAVLLALKHSAEQFWPLARKSLQSGRESTYRTVAAILALLGDSRSQRLCLLAMKRSRNPLKIAYCHMALLTMWGKEDTLSVQQAVRRWLKKCETENTFLDFDGASIESFGRVRDLLGERFKSTVDKLADSVLTHRTKVLGIKDL